MILMLECIALLTNPKLLIWVKDNEPALTEIMDRQRLTSVSLQSERIVDRERLASDAQQTLQNFVRSASMRFPKAMHHASLLDDDNDTKNVAESEEQSKSDQVRINRREADNEDEDLELTAILVDRTRPSTSSKPSSVATSAPSLVEAEDESDWELV